MNNVYSTEYTIASDIERGVAEMNLIYIYQYNVNSSE